VANFGVRDATVPETYVPYAHAGFPGLAFLLRTSGDPLRVLGPARREINSIDPQIALVRPRPLEEILQDVFYAQPRFSLIVLGMFAGTGLILVALGVYGVMAYAVSQQTKDIAIRIALGSERRQVLRMVFRSGFQLLGVGIVVGLVAGSATNRLLTTQLWNTTPHDPVTLASAVALVLAIGALACCVPAVRAMRVEPIVALRQE
jgi:putative ABC transport system permease protein